MKVSCESCYFWHQRAVFETETSGECRRHSPVIDRGMTVFPITDSVDWCGDFESKRDFMPRQPASSECVPQVQSQGQNSGTGA